MSTGVQEQAAQQWRRGSTTEENSGAGGQGGASGGSGTGSGGKSPSHPIDLMKLLVWAVGALIALVVWTFLEQRSDVKEQTKLLSQLNERVARVEANLSKPVLADAAEDDRLKKEMAKQFDAINKRLDRLIDRQSPKPKRN